MMKWERYIAVYNRDGTRDLKLRGLMSFHQNRTLPNDGMHASDIPLPMVYVVNERSDCWGVMVTAAVTPQIPI